MRLDINGADAASGSGYDTIQDEGTPLTQRTTLNFVGAGVSATDSGGITVVTIAGGAGSGATGTTTVDFGAFPGSSDTSLAITGQASIVAGSIVDAWITPAATADHTADEHFVETLYVVAGNISAGVGFTIYARNSGVLNEPTPVCYGANSVFQATATTVGQKIAQPGVCSMGGNGTRIYGLWTVNWQWS